MTFLNELPGVSMGRRRRGGAGTPLSTLWPHEVTRTASRQVTATNYRSSIGCGYFATSGNHSKYKDC